MRKVGKPLKLSLYHIIRSGYWMNNLWTILSISMSFLSVKLFFPCIFDVSTEIENTPLCKIPCQVKTSLLLFNWIWVVVSLIVYSLIRFQREAFLVPLYSRRNEETSIYLGIISHTLFSIAAIFIALHQLFVICNSWSPYELCFLFLMLGGISYGSAISALFLWMQQYFLWLAVSEKRRERIYYRFSLFFFTGISLVCYR